MNKWMRLALVVALCVAFVAVAGGCNTVRGMGKDIEKGGEKIQDAAS